LSCTTSRRIVITQTDVEESYKFTRKVARRWADTLFRTDDESNREVVKIIKLVLENGEFLDEFYEDDVLRLLERPHDDDHGGEASASDDSSRSSDDSDDLHLESSLKSSAEHNQDTCPLVVGKNPSLGIQKSIPHATLLHVGQLDCCNLNAKAELLQQGTAAEWTPLSALPNSTSLVHIPNTEIMAQERIEKIHDDQLYGRPALKMPPRMNVREQISILDQLAMAANKGEEDGRKQTMWPCDWNIIQRQAERNRERLHPTKVKKEHDIVGEGEEHDMEDIIEVIPKCLLADDELIHEYEEGGGEGEEKEDGGGNCREQTAKGSTSTDAISQHEGDNIELNDTCEDTNLEEVSGDCVNDDGPLMIVETKDGERAVRRVSSTHEIFSKSWTGRKKMRKHDKVARAGLEIQQGAIGSVPPANNGIMREPTAWGHMEWTIQEVKQKIGERELGELDEVMIHHDNESALLNHSCQGYLKTVGNIHLFEQCRVGQWRGYMDEISSHDDKESDGYVDKSILKKRKTAHRKAKRQRLYPNYEVGTKGYQDSKLQSKILRVNQGKEGMRASQYVNLDEQENQCMELDLGECILSMIIPSENEHVVPCKRTMAFRSLEISLSEL
jgi:hypothetical protein